MRRRIYPYDIAIVRPSALLPDYVLPFARGPLLHKHSLQRMTNNAISLCKVLRGRGAWEHGERQHDSEGAESAFHDGLHRMQKKRGLLRVDSDNVVECACYGYIFNIQKVISKTILSLDDGLDFVLGWRNGRFLKVASVRFSVSVDGKGKSIFECFLPPVEQGFNRTAIRRGNTRSRIYISSVAWIIFTQHFKRVLRLLHAAHVTLRAPEFAPTQRPHGLRGNLSTGLGHRALRSFVAAEWCTIRSSGPRGPRRRWHTLRAPSNRRNPPHAAPLRGRALPSLPSGPGYGRVWAWLANGARGGVWRGWGAALSRASGAPRPTTGKPRERA